MVSLTRVMHILLCACSGSALLTSCGSVVRYSEIWSTPAHIHREGGEFEQPRELSAKDLFLYGSERGVNFKVDSSSYLRTKATSWVLGVAPIPEQGGPQRTQFEIAVGLNSNEAGAELVRIDGGIYYSNQESPLMPSSVVVAERALCSALSTPIGKPVDRFPVPIRLSHDKSHLLDKPIADFSAYTCFVFTFMATPDPLRSFEFKVGLLKYPTQEVKPMSIFFSGGYLKTMVR